MRGIRVTEWQTGGRGWEGIVFHALRAKPRLLAHRVPPPPHPPLFAPWCNWNNIRGHPPIDAKSPEPPRTPPAAFVRRLLRQHVAVREEMTGY